MPEPIITPPAATPNPADAQNQSLLETAGKEDVTLLEEAGVQQQAEEKRLLEADEATLSTEDKAKKTDIVKANEEKRLLKTDEKDLSDADKAKRTELVKAKEEAEKSKVVPEKYEFKIPEGYAIDEALKDKVSAAFKAKGYTQGQAQTAIDLYVEIQKEQATLQEKTFQDMNKEARNETIKALGADYKAQLAYVAKIRDNYFSEETNRILNASGMSNQKPFILDIIKLGKVLSEDRIPSVGKPGQPGNNASPADVFYPNQK